MKIIFAKQLLALRKERELSQEELAEKMFVSRQAISTWEKGESQPNLDTIEILAKILDVPVEILLFGNNAQNDSFIHRKLDELLTQDESDKDWHENHRWREWHYAPINNGWEFLARYYWVIFGIIGLAIYAYSQIK